jgi:hypothetical protein
LAPEFASFPKYQRILPWIDKKNCRFYQFHVNSWIDTLENLRKNIVCVFCQKPEGKRQTRFFWEIKEADKPKVGAQNHLTLFLPIKHLRR